MSDIQSFRQSVEAFIAARGWTPTRFGRTIAGDPLFVFDLREGREPRSDTRTRILKAMLRCAPNVILVGEIRDMETAEIAIQASLTGHLVFSTVHTNDAPSALTRLSDLGVKPFLVSAAVHFVLAQRLVRRLCKECAESYQPHPNELRAVGLDQRHYDGQSFRRARGCRAAIRAVPRPRGGARRGRPWR